MSMCVFVGVCSNSSLKQLGYLKLNFTWNHHGIGEEKYSNNSGHIFVVLHFDIASLQGAGAFGKDLTTNLAPQCNAFSRALEIEKLKALLFPVYLLAWKNYKKT